MTHAIRTGTTDQIAFFRAYDTDGTAKVDLTSATTGLTLSVFRIGASAVSISSLSDKAADNTTHSDGAIRQVQGNLYTVDLPDAAQATQVASICVKGTYTGGVIEGVPHPIVGYDGTADAIGALKPTTAGRTLTVSSDGVADANTVQISGDSVAADNAESFFDGTGYAGTNNVIPTVTTVTTSVPAVALAASQPNYAPLTTLGTNAPVGWINADAIASDTITAAKLATDAVAEIADAVWDEPMSGHTTDGTYGGRIVRAANSNVSVQITGSQHIAADVHEFQTGVFDSDAIAASAVTTIQSGLATTVQLTTVEGKIDTIDNFVDTEVAAIKLVTDKIDTMVEVDGLVYRYTTNALEQAPAGGGGGGGTDWTTDERTAIRTILGIPGSGTTPADPSDGVLYDIKQKTDQIGSAGAITNLLAGAVLEPGTITSFPSELVIGDSYQETDGREIQIPLVDTDGNVLTTVGSRNLADATATFEIRRINESDSTRVITGTATIVDPPGTGTGAGAPYAVVELPADETAKGLVSYRYKGKLVLTWSGPGTDVYSFDTETIKFTY